MTVDFEGRAHEVLPNLWVGNALACPIAQRLGMITICVNNEICRERECKWYPLNKGFVQSLSLDSLITTLQINWVSHQHRVLIHCFAGIERSPLVVAWWMQQKLGLSWDDAYRWLKDRRSCIMDRREWVDDSL